MYSMNLCMQQKYEKNLGIQSLVKENYLFFHITSAVNFANLLFTLHQFKVNNINLIPYEGICNRRYRLYRFAYCC